MNRSVTLAAAASLLYVGVTATWSHGIAAWAIAWWGSLALAFALGAKLPSIRWILYGFAYLTAIVVCAQPWLPVGLNQNALGCAIAMALAVALLYEIWIFLPIAAAGLWVTQSRGALFAAGATCAIALWRRFPATALSLFTLSIVAGSLVWEAKVAANVVDNIAQRLGIWQDTINHLTPFGLGLGTFADAYASWPVHRNMGGMTTAHAYNDFLELVFELGIGTIPLWILIALCLEVTAPIRLICFAFLFCSLTFFPLFIPPLGHVFALVLGKLASERKPYGTMETHPAPLPQGPRQHVGAN